MRTAIGRDHFIDLVVVVVRTAIGTVMEKSFCHTHLTTYKGQVAETFPHHGSDNFIDLLGRTTISSDDGLIW